MTELFARPSFTRLSTKLAVLYAGLFGAILIFVSLAVFTAITHNATRLVRDELQASGTVFDRIWALRSEQMRESAALLSKDFGFRAAVATSDAATVRSALQNLHARLGIDLAVIVGVDGRIVTDSGRSLGPAAEPLYRALDSGEGVGGVFMLDGMPYQAVSAPVLSPTLAGWVVFAAKLDDREMASLERLAAFPLQAVVLDRRAGGAWTPATGRVGDAERGRVSRFIADAVASGAKAPLVLPGPAGGSIAMVKPLASLNPASPAVLLLRYPLARAMAPFEPLIRTLVLTGAGGVLLVVVGSFMLAGGLAKPITALDEAAQRLARGEEDAAVVVDGRDEIARLAESFNAMAAEIRDREAKMRRDAETLVVALDRAEAANRTTNQFLANMSHEVRTPLNGVLGLSHVLATTVKDPTQQELVAQVIASAETLETLLSDILDAAKLGARETEVRLEPFALDVCMRAIVAAWSGRAEKRGLRLVVDIAAGAERVVLGDPARLRQILDNLIGNAVKFTHQGEVRLTVRAGGQVARPRFRFEVSDTGVGFDLAMKERLFQPFQQGDSSATRRYGGTGLGLSISRGLAELMGGVLDGAPRSEGGSIFFLELPLALVAGADLTQSRASA
ncbi:MAG TPA: ATP-binding protein [Caulobacteraceae bacterium]|jgi:signal transduction histidine kinase|nr:ATP-binding protein [Caulobacteraceae bacterium]